MIEGKKRERFLRDLRQLLNRHSIENYSNTPDWILASHMLGSLDIFNATTNARSEFYGRSTGLASGVEKGDGT